MLRDNVEKKIGLGVMEAFPPAAAATASSKLC
jgi:hypothetical protein